MGSMLFGFDENIRCISDVELIGPSDEELCIAYKTTARFLGGGIYLKDDGYVLALVPEEGDEATSYFSLTEDEIITYQAEGLLPSPLPSYSIPITDYLWGYSLWIIVAIAIVWSFFPRRRSRIKREDTDDDSENSHKPSR